MHSPLGILMRLFSFGMYVAFYVACFSLLFFCKSATFIAARMTSLGDNVYDSNLYEYPVELRKYTTVMMIRCQKPVHFTGLN